MINRPFQIEIAVYQPAKLSMLKFYCDFLDRYFNRNDFELIQMDTDSNYIAISADRLEDVVRPELRQNLTQRSSRGLHGTSGAGVRQGFPNLNVKAAE